MRFYVILIVFFFSFVNAALAQGGRRPLFYEEEDVGNNARDYTYEDTFIPPLPPKRPDKLNVPQSYIDHLLLEEAIRQDELEEILIEQNGRDILNQIDPQN